MGDQICDLLLYNSQEGDCGSSSSFTVEYTHTVHIHNLTSHFSEVLTTSLHDTVSAVMDRRQHHQLFKRSRETRRPVQAGGSCSGRRCCSTETKNHLHFLSEHVKRK